VLGGLVEPMETVKDSTSSAIKSSTADIMAVSVAPEPSPTENVTVSGSTALKSAAVQKERVDWCILRKLLV